MKIRRILFSVFAAALTATLAAGECENASQPENKNIAAQKEKIRILREKAEKGDAEAQYGLSCCYLLGDGVEKDMKQAVMWIRRSAEQGNAEAQCSLGVCYANGAGVEQDMKQAVVWIRKSAEQGNAEAQKALKDLGQ